MRLGLRLYSAMVFKFASGWLGPIAMSLALVGVTTAVLWHIEVGLDLDPLIFIYFVPTTYIALRYGSTAAMIATIMSCVSAAYFLIPPRFSFAVANPLDVMQLVFFCLLAMLASQVVSGFVKDRNVERRRHPARFEILAATRAKVAALFDHLRL